MRRWIPRAENEDNSGDVHVPVHAADGAKLIRPTCCCAGKISFAEFDASVQGWINHVRYADTWGLRRHVLGKPLKRVPR